MDVRVNANAIANMNASGVLKLAVSVGATALDYLRAKMGTLLILSAPANQSLRITHSRSVWRLLLAHLLSRSLLPLCR